MKKVICGLCVALLATSFTACSDKQNAQQEEERVENVQTIKMVASEVEREIILPTTLQGYQYMNVSSSISGMIDEILVEEGDRVKKGDLLVKMDPTQYTTTKLAFANLSVEMSRMDALKEAGSISQQVYDQTKTQFDQTQEQLALYEQNTFVRADFSGAIAAKNFQDGELCAGQPILVLTQINRLKAYVNIPEAYFPFVKKGMALTVASEIYPGKTFPATIEVVFPTIDPASHTFSVKINIPNGSELLRPGMYATTTIPVGRTQGLMVPYPSVLKLIGSNQRYVFINENGHAKRVTVELGKRVNSNIEIISDELKEGDELVCVGQGRLVNGIKLNVVNDSIQ